MIAEIIDGIVLDGDPNMVLPNGVTPLIQCITEKDKKSFEKLLKMNNVNVFKTDREDNTALHLAIDAGMLEYVKALVGYIKKFPVKKKWNVNVANKAGDSLLHLAALQDDPEYLRLSVTIDGIDLNAKDISGATALHSVTDQNKVAHCDVLLNAGADPNMQDKWSVTALYIAVKKDYIEIVKRLADVPSLNINLYTSRGETAVHRAIKEMHLGCFVVLRERDEFDVNILTSDKSGGWSLLYLAAENKDLEALDLLLGHPSIQIDLQSKKKKITALMEAARRGSKGCVAKLLANNADPNIEDYQQKTASMYAATRLADLKAELIQIKTAEAVAAEMKECIVLLAEAEEFRRNAGSTMPKAKYEAIVFEVKSESQKAREAGEPEPKPSRDSVLEGVIPEEYELPGGSVKGNAGGRKSRCPSGPYGFFE